MKTTIKLFIFAAIYAGGIAMLVQSSTAWTGELGYRIIHLLLFITSILALINRPKKKREDAYQVIAYWCFFLACLIYALTYLSAVVTHDLPLLLQ